MTYEPKGATPATATTNQEATGLYAMDDRRDFADADRNLLAPLPGQVLGDDGHVVFDPEWLAFVGDDVDTPDTVNPSLWRQSQVMRRGASTRSPTGSTRCATTTWPT